VGHEWPRPNRAQSTSVALATTRAAALLHVLRDPLGYPASEDDAADYGEEDRDPMYRGEH
jgi:hypothetical protein